MDDEQDVNEIEQLRQQVAELKIQLQSCRDDKARLEEENDLLAFENDHLRRKLVEAEAGLATAHACRPPPLPSIDQLELSEADTQLDIFEEGDGSYVTTALHRLENCCGGKNVVASSFFVSPDKDEMGDMMVCGGVDGCLVGFDVAAGVRIFSHRVLAPVLCIDCAPPYIACGTMDGSVFVLHFADLSDSSPLVTQFKNHSKYVVGLAWSYGGTFLATASYDKFVHLYHRNALGEMEKVRSVQFQTTPECVVFTRGPYHRPPPDQPSQTAAQPPSDEPYEVIVGLRDSCHLVYLDVSTGVQRAISANEKAWDTHCSFTPLWLSVSPDRKYLLIATDKSMHLVLRMHSNRRLRVLAGHQAGDYSKPVAAWDPTGRYVYCNSEEDATLYVYSLCAQKICHKLRGHSGIVRGVAVHPYRALVATVSYDKAAVLWHATPGAGTA